MLLVAIFLFLFLFLFTYKESFENNIYAMTFGGGGQNYYDAVQRINKELETIKVFDKIFLFYDTDLKKDKDFWDKHKNFIETNKRGYGYWLWKPYLISKTLKKINDGDILVYLDSGCEIDNDKSKLEEIIKKCNTYDMLYTLTGHSNKSYTKKDIVRHFNLKDEDIENEQKQATIIFIKKNKLTCEFIDDWYNACKYNLIDDSESIEINDVTFIENRHDQAVFSILLNTDKYKVLNTKNNYIDPYPIKISRRRSK
jgi:hypothetical protein